MAKDYRRIDKDPVMDIVRTGFQQTGREIKDVAACAGVHERTIKKWLVGETRRPQNITVELVLLELGITRVATWIATGANVHKGGKGQIALGKEMT